MSAHTPGPWTYRLRGTAGDSYYDVDTASGLPRHKFREQIAMVMGGLGYGGEGEANARLIAAAPEMLEALKDIVTAYAAELSSHGYMNEIINSDPFVQKARAAIAKAKGESK